MLLLSLVFSSSHLPGFPSLLLHFASTSAGMSVQGVWEAKLLLHPNPPCICTSGYCGRCHPCSDLSSPLPSLLGGPAQQCQARHHSCAALGGHGHVLLPHTKAGSSKRLVERLSSQKTLVQHNLNIPQDHFHLVEETDIILLTHLVPGSEELLDLAPCCEVVLCPHLAGRAWAVAVWYGFACAHRSLWSGAACACAQAEHTSPGAELLCALLTSSFTSAVTAPEQTSLGNHSRKSLGWLT